MPLEKGLKDPRVTELAAGSAKYLSRHIHCAHLWCFPAPRRLLCKKSRDVIPLPCRQQLSALRARFPDMWQPFSTGQQRGDDPERMSRTPEGHNWNIHPKHRRHWEEMETAQTEHMGLRVTRLFVIVLTKQHLPSFSIRSTTITRAHTQINCETNKTPTVWNVNAWT